MNVPKLFFSLTISIFSFITLFGGQIADRKYIGLESRSDLKYAFDTIMLRTRDMNVYPCKKGKNTLSLYVENTSDNELVFAVHIQSNIRINASVGRGWGVVFYDTIPPGEKKRIEHSFPIYSDLTEGINLRLRFYEMRLSVEWDFEKYFFSKTYDHHGIEKLFRAENTFPVSPNSKVIDAFTKVQDLLRMKEYTKVWNCFTKAHQEAKYQGDIKGFIGKAGKGQALDHWTASQFMKLLPEESVTLEDGRKLLRLTLDNTEWRIAFKYIDEFWHIDWIEGYPTLVDLWLTWPVRLLPQLHKVSTKHFDFYFYKDSYAAHEIDGIGKTREEGYEKICHYLDLKTDQRIITVFFNDFETKAIETGHRGKGAALDTSIIEVYNKEIQAHPYHETVHILSASFGSPPALFNEGLAEYLEIVLAGKDSTELQMDLNEKIKALKNSSDWIPIKELLTFTDIPGKSQAHVSYPEATAFVKFLIETYGKQRFIESFIQLINSEEKIIQMENLDRLAKIYSTSVDKLIEDFHIYYQDIPAGL